MWNLPLAAMAQVSSFLGTAPVQASCSKQKAMNVRGATPSACAHTSAWHRRLSLMKPRRSAPRADLQGVPDLAASGRPSTSRATTSRPSFARSSPPREAKRASLSSVDKSGTLEAKKARTTTALGAVCGTGTSGFDVGFDLETGGWKEGHSVRRRLDESDWKLPGGVLIEERAKIDSSTFSSLFSDKKPSGRDKRTTSSKVRRRALKNDDSLVYKVVRKLNGDNLDLLLEEEMAGRGSQLWQRGNGKLAINKTASGAQKSAPSRPLEPLVVGTSQGANGTYSDFVAQVGTGFPELADVEGSTYWEEAVVEAASNLQGLKSLQGNSSSDNGACPGPKVRDDNASAQQSPLQVPWKTNISKCLENDRRVVAEGMNWVSHVALPGMKAAVNDFLGSERVQGLRSLPTSAPSWPQPSYPEMRAASDIYPLKTGLSGKELVKADIQALQDYVGVVQKWCSLWLTPLQETYDAEEVAAFFSLRPHLLVFRVFEVSAALGLVALQTTVDRAVSATKGDLQLEDEMEEVTRKGAERLKHCLVRLGPAFIKVAQSISARPDLIGSATAKVLAELQDRLPPFPNEEAIAIIEEELGRPVNELFSYISDEPVAAASFGQVYKGRTVHGEEVAVKVQRPGVLFSVARDIYILRLGLGLLRKVAKMNSDISVLADELGRGLYGELDYNMEAANAKEFLEAHAHLKYIVVPRSLPRMTSKRVLTMEWVQGDRPGDMQRIAEGHSSSGQLPSVKDQSQAKQHLMSMVSMGVEASLIQLLETGVLHADPHPGNLLFTANGSLGYLDFGLLCRMEKKHQAAMFASIAHLVNGEWRYLADDLADMDVLKPTTDRFELQLALEDAFGSGPDALVVQEGLPNFKFGQVAGKLWEVAVKFRFRLPPYFTLVLRSLASLEGIALSVDPDFKIFASAYPYVVSRLFTDNSGSTRRVLHSLLLDRNKQFRWDRITSFVSMARPESTKLALPVSVSGEESKQLQPDLMAAIVKLALSYQGHAIRRVLLEADTVGLARAFVSEKAAPLRRKVGELAAAIFYKEWSSWRQPSSTGARPESAVEAEVSADASRMTGRRCLLLLSTLFGRLRGSPLMALRVGWACTTMVCFAVALALHRAAIAAVERHVLTPARVTKMKQRLISVPTAFAVA